MTQRIRRLIMFSFIGAFFILAPILIFYASGYRIDTSRNKILRTGTLMLEAKGLKKAQIYVNGNLFDKTLDDKIFIYNLLPGEYRIKVAKEGYYDWQKKVTISSGLTTFANNIILLKNQVPLQLVAGQVSNFSLAPDWTKLVYLLETNSFQELYLLNLETQAEDLIYRTDPQAKISFSWAPSSKKILAQINNQSLILGIENLKQNLDLSATISPPLSNLKWDLQSDNLLYGQAKNAFYEINLLDKISKKIFEPEKIKDGPEPKINQEFYSESNDIFYIAQDLANNALYKYNLNFKTNKRITSLDKSNNYHFISSTNNYLGLIDLDLQKLHLIKKVNTDTEINIIGNETIKEFTAKDASWDKTQKQLLIYDDFQLNTYNSESNQQTFINRYGEVIKTSSWYYDPGHLLVRFNNNVKILDINNVDNGTINSTELINFDSLLNVYLDKNGDNIFFNGKIGKQEGLYELELR